MRLISNNSISVTDVSIKNKSKPKMKFAILILIFVLLSPHSMRAEDSLGWRKDSTSIADSPNMKSKGGFGAELLLTESTQFFDDWSKPEIPKLTTLENDKAHRNVPLFTAILFVDPGTDTNGSADIPCDIIVRKPDGSLYGEQRNVVCFKGKYIVPAHNLQLSQGRMGIRIEPQDPSGTYTVEATVYDHIKNVELPLRAKFQIVQ